MTQIEPDREVGDGPQPLPTDYEVRESMLEEPEPTREPGRDHTLIDRDR